MVHPELYFELSLDEVREVTRFAVVDAERVLPLFERDCPGDGRARAAVEAARSFAAGGERGKVLRTSALAAHRAARDATTQAAEHAAWSAGDAAASAFLHPFAKADQVGHILRASAHAACAVAADAGTDDAALVRIEESRARATRIVREVLLRYPPAATGRSRVAALMKHLDTELRR